MREQILKNPETDALYLKVREAKRAAVRGLSDPKTTTATRQEFRGLNAEFQAICARIEGNSDLDTITNALADFGSKVDIALQRIRSDAESWATLWHAADRAASLLDFCWKNVPDTDLDGQERIMRLAKPINLACEASGRAHFDWAWWTNVARGAVCELEALLPAAAA